MKKGSINPHLYKARIGICPVCKKTFRATKDFKERKQKYCSAICYREIWVKTIRPRMKDNPGLIGELNPSWKGDNVGYWGIHVWIQKQLGKPNKCEHCNLTNCKKYEWASKNHSYKRDIKEWLRLCTKCHREYDKKICQKSQND